MGAGPALVVIVVCEPDRCGSESDLRVSEDDPENKQPRSRSPASGEEKT